MNAAAWMLLHERAREPPGAVCTPHEVARMSYTINKALGIVFIRLLFMHSSS